MPVDAQSFGCADKAVWVDLLNPTKEEEKLVEKLIGTNVPTREEMLEIEPSSRLYEKNGAVFMTMAVLYGIDEGHPSTDPISFILTDKHLVTVRYIEPRPILVFAEHAYAEPELVTDPLKILVRMLDAVVDRIADELEEAGRNIATISSQVFERRMRNERRNPELRYEALMIRIGEVQRHQGLGRGRTAGPEPHGVLVGDRDQAAQVRRGRCGPPPS